MNGIPDCTGCSNSSRRDFVRQGAATLVSMAAALGLTPTVVAALPVHFRTGSRTGAAELAYPLPPADGVMVDRPNEVIVVRWESRVFAFALSCPHQRSMLKWRESETRFQCTKHKSRYLPDGTFVSGRATRGMDRYPVRLAGNSLVVETSASIRQDEDETAWTAAGLSLTAP